MFEEEKEYIRKIGLEVGDEIHIDNIENPADAQMTDYIDGEFEVESIDDAGQIHLKGKGLAVIPLADDFHIVRKKRKEREL